MFRLLEDKFSDFVQESALALYKTVLLCVSALSLGLLPGKGLGNTWPPFQAQVSEKPRIVKDHETVYPIIQRG